MFFAGLLLILGSSTAGITMMILKSLEDQPEPIEIPGQFKRLGSAAGAGMDSNDKDLYIKHLQDQIRHLRGSPTPAWAVTPTAPGLSPPSPAAITPPSPAAITPPSPPPSPDFTIELSAIDLPFDAPSFCLKVKDCILRGLTKTETLEEVWGLPPSAKTGRKESKYYRCSQLYDRLRDETENEIRNNIRSQLELMSNGNENIC